MYIGHRDSEHNFFKYSCLLPRRLYCTFYVDVWTGQCIALCEFKMVKKKLYEKNLYERCTLCGCE